MTQQENIPDDKKEAVEQARKEDREGYILNRRRLLQGIGAGGAGAVAMGAGGDAVPEQFQAVDDAQAFGPVAPVAAVVFAYVSVSETQGSYDPRDWFSESGSSIEKEVSETEKTLQEASHQNAIEAQGTNTQFTDNYQNDLRFIEAKVEQLIDQKILGNFDTYTSESGVTNDAETVTSDHLRKTINTVLETYNYNALNSRQIMANLDEATFSGQYGVAEIVEVSSVDDLNQFDQGSYYNIPANTIIQQKSNITVGQMITFNGGDAAWVGNGYEVQHTSGFSGTTFGTGSAINGASLHSVTAPTIRAYTDTQVNILDGSDISSIDKSSTSYEGSVYVDSTSTVGFSGSYIVDSELQITPYKSNVTLDPADISSTVVTTGVTNKAEETVDMPAVEKTLDSSYYSADNPATLAVPYDLDAGAFVDHTTTSLVVKTSTSGNASYAEILPMAEYNSIIDTRDTLSGQAYTSAQTYASSLWTDYVSQNDSVGDLTAEERADFASLIRDINKENPRSIIQSYVTAYDGLVKPYTTEVEVTGVSSGDVHTGALFSTDLKSLVGSQTLSTGTVLDVDGGSNSETFTSVAQGDTVTVSNTPIQEITAATDSGGTDVSGSVNIVDSVAGTVEYTGSSTIDLTLDYNYGVSRTFVVDPDAEKATQDLTGEDYEVTSISQGDSSVDSVDLRTYEFQNTDLTQTVEALKDLEVTINKTSGGGGGGWFGGGLPWWLQVIGGGGLIYVLYEVFGNQDDGKGKNGGGFA